jgi:hypothetical protein
LHWSDVSGSTIYSTFSGLVGDLNNDGDSNTILDAEIGALQNLNQAILDKGFTDANVNLKLIPFATYASAIDVNLGADLNTQLSQLQGGGSTFYERAFIEAHQFFISNQDSDTADMLFFLSDGEPNYIDYLEEFALLDAMGVTVKSIGVGNGANLTILNAIDNTGGADLVDDVTQLNASLLGNPIEKVDLIDFNILLDGVDVPEFDMNDVISDTFGYHVDVTVGDINPYLGNVTTITAEFIFEDGSVVDSSADISGLLPDII